MNTLGILNTILLGAIFIVLISILSKMPSTRGDLIRSSLSDANRDAMEEKSVLVYPVR